MDFNSTGSAPRRNAEFSLGRFGGLGGFGDSSAQFSLRATPLGYLAAVFFEHEKHHFGYTITDQSFASRIGFEHCRSSFQ